MRQRLGVGARVWLDPERNVAADDDRQSENGVCALAGDEGVAQIADVMAAGLPGVV